jgi:flavin reductase (DIM6/NTAB) family NADH-FMN oxidoreductase RutF
MSSPQFHSGIDPDTYRKVCSQFATGVAVATVRAADGTPHGLTVSSFTPVSIDPPLILICIDFRCNAIEHFRAGPFFAVNILTDGQQALSVTFAAKPEGRFEGVDWMAGETGAPRLTGALATIECRLERVLDVGDHALIFGEVVEARVYGGRPLLYFDRDYRAMR